MSQNELVIKQSEKPKSSRRATEKKKERKKTISCKMAKYRKERTGSMMVEGFTNTTTTFIIIIDIIITILDATRAAVTIPNFNPYPSSLFSILVLSGAGGSTVMSRLVHYLKVGAILRSHKANVELELEAHKLPFHRIPEQDDLVAIAELIHIFSLVRLPIEDYARATADTEHHHHVVLRLPVVLESTLARIGLLLASWMLDLDG